MRTPEPTLQQHTIGGLSVFTCWKGQAEVGRGSWNGRCGAQQKRGLLLVRAGMAGASSPACHESCVLPVSAAGARNVLMQGRLHLRREEGGHDTSQRLCCCA
jgi:hypothetical protein